MKKIAVILGTALVLLPNIKYLADFRYRFDPDLQRSVCRSLLCFDELLLESANRFADGSKEDAAVALANLQEALRRNVASPNRWCDVGEALLAAGRIDEARYCFTRAVELGPQSPPVFWRAALFYTRINEPNLSQEHMAKMLELVPEYRELAFQTYLANKNGVLETLEHGIPKGSALSQDYFRYLLTQDAAPQDLTKVWDWLEDHSQADDYLTGDYTDFLLRKSEYFLAGEVWKRTAVHRDDAYLKPNLVFNGGFELEPLQSGLDWRISPIQGAEIRRDSSMAFSGSSSLHIEFRGESNIAFNSVRNEVVAQPGRYHFKAWIRTADLTTDQGIGFRISDSSGRVNLQTPPLAGSRDWTAVDLEFTLTGPVRLLRIEVVRQPSWKFDNKISGGAWIDGVSLVRS
jgi:hypothetical protein